MVAVRKATRQDKEAIWQVHTSAIRQVCSTHYAPEEIEVWAGRLTPESYEDVIDKQDFLVAEEGGAIIGFGQLDAETGEIEAIYVSPDHVGRGVGAMLLQSLEEKARGSGLKSLHLNSSLNAVRFYKTAGYKPQHDSKHRLRDDMQIDCVYMTKQLSS